MGNGSLGKQKQGSSEQRQCLEIWILLRHLVSKNKVKEQSRRFSVSAVSLHTQAQTHIAHLYPHMYPHTCVLENAPPTYSGIEAKNELETFRKWLLTLSCSKSLFRHTGSNRLFIYLFFAINYVMSLYGLNMKYSSNSFGLKY